MTTEFTGTEFTGTEFTGTEFAKTEATSVRRTATGIRLTRTFPAPPALVFRTLSEREHLMRWWGPPNCRVVECRVDFRVGGVWHYRLLSPDGTEHWSRAVYREIDPDERIVYLETGSDAAGHVVQDRPGAVVTITLSPDVGGTRFDALLVYVSELDRDRAVANGVEAGFGAALNQLSTLLTEYSRTSPPDATGLRD